MLRFEISYALPVGYVADDNGYMHPMGSKPTTVVMDFHTYDAFDRWLITQKHVIDWKEIPITTLDAGAVVRYS